MLKEVKEYPKDGTQFLMTWIFNGKPWCLACVYRDDEVWSYDRAGGSFEPFGLLGGCNNVQYWIVSGV